MSIKPKLGIALCGGGARGAAHIGVLRALEENGISPEYISGASAGAIMGALYSAGNTSEQVLLIAKYSSLLSGITHSIGRDFVAVWSAEKVN